MWGRSNGVILWGAYCWQILWGKTPGAIPWGPRGESLDGTLWGSPMGEIGWGGSSGVDTLVGMLLGHTLGGIRLGDLEGNFLAFSIGIPWGPLEEILWPGPSGGDRSSGGGPLGDRGPLGAILGGGIFRGVPRGPSLGKSFAGASWGGSPKVYPCVGCEG